ncbi:MAG: hypothetical protein EON48_07975, partial [Acetobacteraceae bacterium]
MAALEFDRIVAVGSHLMLPAGQAALVQAAAISGLTGFLLWVAFALVVRGISRIVLKPYDALADRLDLLVDGGVDDLGDLRGPAVGVRRLARSVFFFRQQVIASQGSRARLQARYDALYQEHADERQLLMSILAGRSAPAMDRILSPHPIAPVDPGFDIPTAPDPEARREEPARLSGLVIDLAGRLASPGRPIEFGRGASSQMFDLGPFDLDLTRNHP